MRFFKYIRFLLFFLGILSSPTQGEVISIHQVEYDETFQENKTASSIAELEWLGLLHFKETLEPHHSFPYLFSSESLSQSFPGKFLTLLFQKSSNANPGLVDSWKVIKNKGLDDLARNPNALKYADDLKSKTKLGSSTTTDYRKTFKDNFPELKDEEFIVHHAIEQQVLKTRYPNVITQSEIHSLENLRGIPKNINSDVHLKKIRKLWDEFYDEFPPGVMPTKQHLLDKAKEIDDLFGNLFVPPIR